MEDDPRSGRPSTSKTKENVEQVRQVRSDRRLTVRMIANELSMNSKRVWTEELEMRKELLTDEQKERRVEVCQDILTRLETNPNLLGRTITGGRVMDLSTIHSPSDRALSVQAKMSMSKVKVMLIAFSDVRGIVHKEFLPQGQTINQHIYKDILRRLMRSVCEKRQELWDEKSWVLYHDNAPSHNALSTWEFLVKITLLLWINLLTPLIWLPVTFLFPKLKGTIKGIRFNDVEDIKKP